MRCTELSVPGGASSARPDGDTGDGASGEGHGFGDRCQRWWHGIGGVDWRRFGSRLGLDDHGLGGGGFVSSGLFRRITGIGAHQGALPLRRTLTPGLVEVTLGPRGDRLKDGFDDWGLRERAPARRLRRGLPLVSEECFELQPRSRGPGHRTR